MSDNREWWTCPHCGYHNGPESVAYCQQCSWFGDENEPEDDEPSINTLWMEGSL